MPTIFILFGLRFMFYSDDHDLCMVMLPTEEEKPSIMYNP